MLKKFHTALFVLLLIASLPIFSQTKIDQSKEELKEGSEVHETDTYTHQNRPRKHRRTRDEEANPLTQLVTDIFAYTTYFAVIGNYQIEDHLYNSVAPYPYAPGFTGNYKGYDSISQTFNRFRMDVSDQFLYNNKDLFANHLKVKIRPFQYFYLQTDYHQLMAFDKQTDSYDHLTLLHLNVHYDRLRFEKVNLGWHIGMNYVGNDVQKAGFNMGLNTEVFIGNHISMNLAGKWGWVNQTPIQVLECQAQYHINHTFISIGYEHLEIGSPDYDFAAIGFGVYLP